MITQTELKHFFDYVNGELLWKIKKGQCKVGFPAGVDKGGGYKVIKFNQKIYYVHRLVWLWHYGTFPKECLDHIDGNPSNNDISNLRECTIAQNRQNAAKNKNNTSGYTGVHFSKREQKWMAHCSVNRKFYNLGYYDTVEEAAEAYRIGKSKLHTFHPTVVNR